jgi:hypothetical protein
MPSLIPESVGLDPLNSGLARDLQTHLKTANLKK